MLTIDRPETAPPRSAITSASLNDLRNPPPKNEGSPDRDVHPE